MKKIHKIMVLFFLTLTSISFSQSTVSETLKKVIASSQNKFQSIIGKQIETKNGVEIYECNLKVNNAVTKIYKNLDSDTYSLHIYYDNKINKIQNKTDALIWFKEFKKIIVDKKYAKMETDDDNSYTIMAGFEAGILSSAIIMMWDDNNVSIYINNTIYNSDKKIPSSDSSQPNIVMPKIAMKKEVVSNAISAPVQIKNQPVVETISVKAVSNNSKTTVETKTESTEEIFRKNLDFIKKDAATGFRDSKGGFMEKTKWTNTTYHYSNSSFFNLNDDALIGYNPEEYLKFSKITIPEAYYFTQGFSTDNEKGLFVYDNAERIFDELMVLEKLKKKIVKQEKDDKNRIKEIQYLDKNKQKVLSIFFNLKDKTCSTKIYSDLRPNDLPTYNGCLVLYNIQLNSVVSANTYYVYGKNFKDAEYLYNAIRSKMDATSQRLFSKYEWKPNAGTKQIDDLLKSLNVRENASKVDVDGNYIN